MISREIKVPIYLTPEELAFDFCNMNDIDQAKFFNEVARITEKWDRNFAFQLQYITNNKELTYGARKIMQQIGEYSDIWVKDEQ